jgi:hypothetical protein
VFVFLAKVRQQQEQTGKTFLTRIEQLIDEVCFDPDCPAKKMGDEQCAAGAHKKEVRNELTDCVKAA